MFFLKIVIYMEEERLLISLSNKCVNSTVFNWGVLNPLRFSIVELHRLKRKMRQTFYKKIKNHS